MPPRAGKTTTKTRKSRRFGKLWPIFFVLLAVLVLLHYTGALPAYTPPAQSPAAPVSPLPSGIPVSGELDVYVLDVGQGDSLFLRSPSGKTMLVDAGESQHFDEIDAFLRKQGVEKLDIVVATHPHSDHIGGMSQVISAYGIGQFYLPDALHTSVTFECMLDALEAEDVPVTFVEVAAESPLNLTWDDEVSVQVFSPLAGQSYANLNNWSIMLRVALGNTSILLTGDAEALAEKLVLGSFDPALLSATVLKSGHHGSSTSSSAEFLRAVAPQICVISVGARNSYGHPAEQTLQALADHGAQVFRTDLNGTIRLTLDGSNVSVYTQK